MERHHPARLGDYRLLRRVGLGGMAEVYEAIRGEGTAPRVALKVLLPHLRDKEPVVTGFIDEARICSELSHPNIVAVHDFGQVEGIYYMAMEFVDGIDLRTLLAWQEEAGQRLRPAAGAYVAQELATGLHYIHTRERKIVHRDVTPHNIFITLDGAVKLADFGVAKARERLTRTATGRIKGKLAYLSPEQVRGDPVSERTDVFAVGLLLYELLTGQRANRGQTDVEMLDRAMNPRFPAPSETVPEVGELDHVVAQALARHPAMRTRDASLLADQLEAYLRGDPFDASELKTIVTRATERQRRGEEKLRAAVTATEDDRPAGSLLEAPHWRSAPTVVEEPPALDPLAGFESLSGDRTNPHILAASTDELEATVVSQSEWRVGDVPEQIEASRPYEMPVPMPPVWSPEIPGQASADVDEQIEPAELLTSGEFIPFEDDDSAPTVARPFARLQTGPLPTIASDLLFHEDEMTIPTARDPLDRALHSKGPSPRPPADGFVAARAIEATVEERGPDHSTDQADGVSVIAPEAERNNRRWVWWLLGLLFVLALLAGVVFAVGSERILQLFAPG